MLFNKIASVVQCLFLFMVPVISQGQQYDLLIKNSLV